MSEYTTRVIFGLIVAIVTITVTSLVFGSFGWPSVLCTLFAVAAYNVLREVSLRRKSR